MFVCFFYQCLFSIKVRDIGIDQLKEYCQYMRIDYGCHTYEETESMLTSLYGWDLTSRALDLKRAWIECTSNTTINSSSSLGSLHHIAPSQQPYSSSSKVCTYPTYQLQAIYTRK
jgi:hypothetical protein